MALKDPNNLNYYLFVICYLLIERGKFISPGERNPFLTHR